jgi:hypothetical protein
MTEEDFLTAAGARQHTGQANPIARRWAENMTRSFGELAAAEPVFAQLQNCMDLAVVAALVEARRLPERAGCSLALLRDASELPVMEFDPPRHVASRASLAKKGRNWIIAASGGVKIVPQEFLRRARVKAELEALRIENAVGKHDDWWWN